MRTQIAFISSRIKTWYIFERNVEELCVACDELTNPTDTYESDGLKYSVPPDVHYQRQEIERKFHNFLAAAKTLVDHTRELMKAYESYDCEGTFRTKLRSLESSTIVKFCHDLRNYFLHVENPIDHLQIHITWYEMENHVVSKGRVCITKNSLLAYDKWTVKSEEYIAHAEDVIELKALAKEYFESVSDINDWLNNVFPSHIPRHEQT